MKRDESARPIIVRRVKRVEEGHHGGAWKVAYADFVTAMMAFFLLMWLLSTTSEEQRKGLADYFSPEMPIFSAASGGDGPFGGSSLFSDDTLARDEIGRRRERLDAAAAALDVSFGDIEAELRASSGDAVEADPLLRHIRTRVTDEGLIIEVFDIEGSALFATGTAVPRPVMERLLGMIGRVLARTTNPVAVTGHLGAAPAGVDGFALSADRAQVSRALLVAAGVAEPRLARVTGKSDRSPANADRDSPRNRRVEITLLRRFDRLRARIRTILSGRGKHSARSAGTHEKDGQ
ncbi:flagellar motor protein MotB [soil metagenome]